MKEIKEISNATLTEIVKEEQRIRFGALYVWTGTVRVDEFGDAFQAIKRGNYIEDAINLLSDITKSRSAVSYDVIYPNQREFMTFEVVNTQSRGPSPHGFLGHLFTYDSQGNQVRQVTLENLSV